MLKDNPMVMVWRQVGDLNQGIQHVSGVLNMPEIGHDEFSSMHDAGGTILGSWVQKKAALIADSCSALNFLDRDLAVNPASELMLAPTDINRVASRLSDSIGRPVAPTESAGGNAISYFDADGNLSSVVAPSQGVLNSPIGPKIKALLSAAQTRPESAAASANPAVVIGVRLVVSDLGISIKFYKEVLGLNQLPSSGNFADFDVGRSVLRLEPEPTIGLVRSLRRSKQLDRSWYVFHTPDIIATQQDLERRGVQFPLGIETWDQGRMAYFQDPDGHALVIWEPPTAESPLKINFMPVLNRILSAPA